MTTIKFFTKGTQISGFEVKGHSGYSVEGQDIVCAGISSTVSLVECTINDILGLGATVKVSKRSPHISFYLPGGLSKSTDDTCQVILTGLMVYLSNLQEEYPNNVLVLEQSLEEEKS